MDIYHPVQILVNILFVLIPLYYITRRKSSKKTKTIAKVVLVVVLLGLIGQLGTYLEKQSSKPQKTAVKSASAQVDNLSTIFTSPDGSFTVNFPQYPNVTNSSQDDNGVQVQNDTYIAANTSNDTRYSVQVLKYPQYTDYMRDHQRQMLQQIMQQVNESYSAKVITPGNNGQYLCGYSAYKEHFKFSSDGETYDGYAVSVLNYNNFYILINSGKNTATFNDFVKSFAPKDGCKYSTVL